MRRATQRKFRERKRAERREAERIRAEEEKAEKERKRAQKATINGGDQIEAERMKVQEERPGKECKEGQKEANTGSEEDKFPRTRKAVGSQCPYPVLNSFSALILSIRLAIVASSRHTFLYNIVTSPSITSKHLEKKRRSYQLGVIPC